MKVNRFRRDEKRAERKNIRRAGSRSGFVFQRIRPQTKCDWRHFLMEAIVADKETVPVTVLMAGDGKLAEHFVDGQFATIYLSPRNYHRIHIPCAGIEDRKSVV